MGEYSAGNPYYATWICAEVYQDMYSRRDHYVARADVERTVDGICREANVTNFQHLWTDGVFEAGSDTTRIQYLNAAVAMACAEGEGEGEEWVERPDLGADAVLRRWDHAEVELRLDSLVNRGVLVQEGTRVRHRIPLFRRWLGAGGVAAVRASFGSEVLEARLRPVRSGLESRNVVDVAEGLVYDGHRVSEDRIRAWLEQFGLSGMQELAWALLKRLKERGYFDDGRVRTSLKSVHGMILEEFANQSAFAQIVERKRTQNVFVASLDDKGKSGVDMAYRYRTANGLPSHRCGSIEDAVEFAAGQIARGRTCGIVFVDDFIGTGGSCVGGLGRFEAAVRKKGLESGAMVVGVAAVAGFQEGVETIRGWRGMECHVVTSVELNEGDRAFAPGAGVFDSDEERLAAERLCRGIGEVLEPKQPLGFGDCQALVSFSHRCPNNTLPVFYKAGVEYRGRRWIPLFPR